MEHLTILEKIITNISDTLEHRSSIYIFAAAIYDTWFVGTEFEQNLAKRLVSVWENELNRQVEEGYRRTKYLENRPEFEDYYKKWLERSYKAYDDNKGIQTAVRNILINRKYDIQGLS
jgi:hypothetical protein